MMEIMDSDFQNQSCFAKLEKTDITSEAEVLIGFPIKIERLDDAEGSSVLSDSTSLVRIKTESSSDETDFEIDNKLHGEIIYDAMIKDEGDGEVLNGQILETNHYNPTLGSKNYDYRSLAIKLGLMVKGVMKPTRYLCEFCGLYTRRTQAFIRHYASHFGLSDSLCIECPQCGKKLKYIYLKGHIKNIHSGRIKRYLCDKCDFRTQYKKSFETHQITHTTFKHETVYYKCELCKYETKKKASYNRHKKIHIDVSHLDMFKCDLCPYESKRKSNLSSHMLKHKKVTEAKSYDCELCAYQTKYPHLLRGHIKTNHKKFPESLVRKCDECDFETNNKYSLEVHMKREHRKPQPPKIYKCDKCPYTCVDKSRLKTKHSLIHKDISERILLECYNCGNKYKRKAELRKHMILNHLSKLHT